MKRSSESIERREHRRFRVRKDACVALRSDFRHVGQIIDISMGGLSFSYVPLSELPDGSLELDIFLAGSASYLYKIPFKAVSDSEADGGNLFPSLAMRRYGLRFGELTDSQASQLEYFIRYYAVSD